MARRKDGNDLPPAPGDLRLLQAFVNSADLEAKTEQLRSPQALADWLSFAGLMPAGAALTASDLERALSCRESLRDWLDDGRSRRQRAAEALDEMLTPAVLRARFSADRQMFLGPAAAGLDGAFGRFLAIAAEAQREGTWPRLKICASRTCRAMFYDASSNRSGRWCQARCGSRVSTQAHRDRRRHRGLKVY